MIRTKEELLKNVEEFIDRLTPTTPKMITSTEVRRLIGCSAPTLRKMVREDPTFPRPLVWGKRMKRFSFDEVQKWINTHQM